MPTAKLKQASKVSKRKAAQQSEYEGIPAEWHKRIADVVEVYRQQGETVTPQQAYAMFSKHAEPERAPVLRLAPTPVDTDTIEALEQLLSEARKGHLIGVAYCAMYPGHAYTVDTAGEGRRNPTFVRGMLLALDDCLRQFIGAKT